MGNKFSDYKNNYTNNSHTNDFKQTSNENIEELYHKYSKLDNQSLMDEFIKLSIERKRKGELTDGYFDNLKNTLFPYLTDEQKIYYENLVNKIK